jgi:serine/threonine protein kinase
MVKDRRSTLIPQSTNSSNNYVNNDQRQYYALKVQKSAEHYTEAAMDEVELLDCIANERKACEAELRALGKDTTKEILQFVEHSRYIATLHDSFYHTGPNGKHMCMVFSMLGCNLLSVIKAYNYRGIPTNVVKSMIRGCCMGLDFLHRKCHIIHTDLKPENVLLQFPHQINEEEDMVTNVVKLAEQSQSTRGRRNPFFQSIVDLRKALDDPNLPRTEKKKLRRRLKKKRQKERKRTFHGGNNNNNNNDDDDVSSDEDDDDDDGNDNTLMDEEDDDELETSINYSTAPMLCDYEMGKIIGRSSNSMMSPNGPDVLPVHAHQRVKCRLIHSKFVTCNFGPRLVESDSKLSEIYRNSVTVSTTNASELEYDIETMEVNSSVAQVSFMMRAFTPELELADILSLSLGGIPWKLNNNSRDWHIKLTLEASKVPESLRLPDGKDHTTFFILSQRIRKDIQDDEKEIFADLATLVGENLVDEWSQESDLHEIPSVESISPRNNRPPPASIFTVKFPVTSTFIVMGFLESRLPGVVFMTYKREEGRPQLDNIVFGPQWQSFCRHPLAMRVKEDPLDPICSNASALFGFDLRLVKDFAARPEVDEHGASSFKLSSINEKVLHWWEARNTIQDRVKSFTGIDPSADMVNLIGHDEDVDMLSRISDILTFKEGGKKPDESNTDTSTAPSSRDTSAGSGARGTTPQVDLKDVDTLLKCRSVIVDLGNACWTHRHFSEDIQTRQYRAPEVLIGSKYDTAADIWSLGCMTFELLTGDLLFDPRAGDDYDRDEDHLAMFQELLGKMPKRIALEGKYSKSFFDKRGNLKHIKQLKFWPVQDVLMEKYHFPKEEAQAVADFMMPLLDFDPKTRATALDALGSDWLKIQ